MTDNITRRRTLQIAAGASTAGLLVGGANARGRPPKRVVGTTGPGGSREARRRASEVRHTLDFGDIGQAVAGRFSDEAVRRLRRRDDVRYVERDGTVEAIGEVLPWGVDRVDADVLHAEGETAAGADVAVIDTGIDDDHPDLSSNVGAGEAYVDCKGPNCNYPWSDDNDHGTHCAGIAGAVDDATGVVGVATEATLHAVKVLDDSGSGYWSDVAAGIEYTADQGWDVGSLSLGASSGSRTVKDACQYAYDRGVLLVAAAGNSGPCTDCVGYPAAYDTVVAVGSTDDDDSLSSFSSTGPEVELAAPGGSIYSTVIGGYETYSGTSMACPHVGGAAGHLMASGYTNTEARKRLRDTAEDLGLSSNEQGHGLLDAEAAVLDGSGGSDAAPSVSWVNPGDGDTVSGTVTVQIDAADSEDGDDSLDVTYSVDGGSVRSTTYNSTSGYYEDSWDTTGVSDGDHTLEATATDSAGNTSSSSIAVTTDNADSGPTVDGLSAAEVETSDADAEFDVDWQVSDADGDLDSLDLALTDDTDGGTEDTATVSVSGDGASGTTRLVAVGDDGSGNDYAVDATVTDGAGNTGSGSTTVSETESTNGAPTIDSYSVTEAGSPNPHAEITADWAVSDGDGNLGTVLVEVLDADTGNRVDSARTSVSGGSASGSDSFKIKHASGGTFDVTTTVTDTDGASDSATRTVTE